MVDLQSRFRGCIAASWAGSAMGAAVEGWSRQRIAETYGVLDSFQSYRHYADVTDWQRPPGTTEDGIERQKLIATAIIEKGGRIHAGDLVAVWLRDLDPRRMRYKQEAFDATLVELARAGVPPGELGRLWPWPNIISVARASHPIGLINAGDPQSAADDTFEIGSAYIPRASFGLRWAGLYNAAIAEACRPGATVDSVLEVARRFATYRADATAPFARYDTIEKEVVRAVELAGESTDLPALREAFYRHYDGGHYVTYGQSQANEIVSKGLAIFAATAGDPRAAIVAAVNFGRDTDCLAAVAGGLAGALSGPSALPPEWLDQVNRATLDDPYTNNRRTIEQTADGLLEAFLASRQSLAQSLKTMAARE